MEKNSSDIIVNFSDVTKQYGDLVVLDKLNLEIKKNEMVSIIGPSGSGKELIARKIRENGIYSEIVSHSIKINDIIAKKPSGIILSGGPASVLNENCPTPPLNLFKINIPILGICYGLQIIVKILNGTVERGKGTAEFGRSFLKKADIQSELIDGMFSKDKEQVWMSHGDHVSKIPENFDRKCLLPSMDTTTRRSRFL